MTNYSLLANAIRMLSADSVEKAKSGHPGMPMGMAEIGVALWKNHLQHNPTNPKWINRDRFVVSNGHGSMLLYSLLHLTGYDLTLNDLAQFRQMGSRTPGHPEYGYTAGVETTTGPLGQGLANAVGMALAEKVLAQQFNRDNFNIINHYTYVFLGDGCLMEGISHEVCSLAGTLKLGKLIVFYDDNGISIDGEVADWFNEDVACRFKSYNWHVVDKIDGHDVDAINAAIITAKSELNRPSIIICKTQIGKGSPNKCGKEECHGSPLGSTEIDLVRQHLHWNHPPFTIPDEVYQQFDAKANGHKLECHWNELYTRYQAQYPELAAEFTRRSLRNLPSNWNEIIASGVKKVIENAESIASRKASQNALEHYAQFLPELFGGSADLTGSNLTRWSFAETLAQENNFTGNYLSYGVREFGMSAMLNGIYLYGGFKPFAGTFLAFSDYARNALRMASLIKIAPIFVYTHDSIGLGEDGPTHQPVEQLASLRLIPNMHVWRPSDTVETMIAWGAALSQTQTPSCLVFSRQNLKYITKEKEVIDNIGKGGYIVRSNSTTPQIVIMATGSEVELAYNVYEQLSKEGQEVQLVSMPCLEVFDSQNAVYKDTVLARSSAKFKIAIEAGVATSWYKYVGDNGLIIGMNTFGESAPAPDLFAHFGFTTEKVLAKIKAHIN